MYFKIIVPIIIDLQGFFKTNAAYSIEFWVYDL